MRVEAASKRIDDIVVIKGLYSHGKGDSDKTDLSYPASYTYNVASEHTGIPRRCHREFLGFPKVCHPAEVHH